mmetsp:Transcript_28209/g.65607  ORF Transcript_28209/g.65607 Transcript_28209/m.65607 type:complete len:90 (+) Transcript_28209:269-538(+)
MQQSRPAVEAVPPKPQDEGTQHLQQETRFVSSELSTKDTTSISQEPRPIIIPAVLGNVPETPLVSQEGSLLHRESVHVEAPGSLWQRAQ